MSIQKSTVFFAAINQDIFNIGDGDVIKWNAAVINPGGNYDMTTGAYTGTCRLGQCKAQPLNFQRVSFLVSFFFSAATHSMCVELHSLQSAIRKYTGQSQH